MKLVSVPNMLGCHNFHQKLLVLKKAVQFGVDFDSSIIASGTRMEAHDCTRDGLVSWKHQLEEEASCGACPYIMFSNLPLTCRPSIAPHFMLSHHDD